MRHKECVEARCSRCGLVKPLVKRAKEPICRSCRWRMLLEPCVDCGCARPVSARTERGPLCGYCQRKRKGNQLHKVASCSECRRTRPVSTKVKGEPVCDYCQRKRKAVPCSKCGQSRPVNARTSEGEPLCSSCYHEGRKTPCSICGRLKSVGSRSETGEAICNNCYVKSNPTASFRHHQHKARTRHLCWDLSYEEFMGFWRQSCVYCGSPITYVGLDRIDNSQGYTKSNVCACCSTCNYMRSDQTVEGFLQQVRLIAKHRNLDGNPVEIDQKHLPQPTEERFLDTTHRIA